MFPSHGGGRATGENSNVSPRPEDGARRGGGGDTSKHLLTQHPSFSSSHHQCMYILYMYRESINKSSTFYETPSNPVYT